jgi:hypothetical protein
MGEIIIIGEVFKMALFYNGLPCTPIGFYEQENHIGAPQTNFIVSPRPSNSCLAIFKIYWS